MMHTEQDDYMCVASPDGMARFNRADMTRFLKESLDVLQRPNVCHHIFALEHAMPRLQFGMRGVKWEQPNALNFLGIGDDEWENKKTFLLSIGLHMVDVVTNEPSLFMIEDGGSIKKFEVRYTVFHRDPQGDMNPTVGSMILPLLLTNTSLSPGVLTFAHVTRVRD